MVFNRPRKGLSLIEVVVAVWIAAAVVISLMVLFSGLLGNSKTAKNIAKAATIAQQYIEKLKSDSAFFSGIIASGGRTIKEVEVVSDPNYQGPIEFTVNIQAVPRTVNSSQIDVLINVSWMEKGKQKQSRLETFIPAPL
ncbi:MAG: hypothetical protein M1536_03455 [Firmicutes bacterium]|nr:hypothetical protein [Bacillota bacterium]